MTMKKLWLSWLYLYILTAILGFIPQPGGVAYALLLCVGACFFIPGFMLVYRADIREQYDIVRKVRTISIVALCVDVFLICVNFASALFPGTMGVAWGIVLHVMLVLFTAPMVCAQAWVVALFGWACLLFYALSVLKKNR